MTPDDLETQARKLNEADKQIRAGIEAYRSEGYSANEIEERIEELVEGEQ